MTKTPKFAQRAGLPTKYIT